MQRSVYLYRSCFCWLNNYEAWIISDIVIQQWVGWRILSHSHLIPTADGPIRRHTQVTIYLYFHDARRVRQRGPFVITENSDKNILSRFYPRDVACIYRLLTITRDPFGFLSTEWFRKKIWFELIVWNGKNLMYYDRKTFLNIPPI